MRHARTWQGMIAGLVVVGGVLGCASLKVTSDYDESADFSRYKTFAVAPMKGLDEITANRIQTAITQALKGRGLQPVENNPDLGVVVGIKLSNQQYVTTTGYGGYGWRGGVGMSTSTVQNVPVGTLVVSLADEASKKLVWRGTATDTMDSEASPERKQQQLNAAMTQLFATFPPAAKK